MKCLMNIIKNRPCKNIEWDLGHHEINYGDHLYGDSYGDSYGKCRHCGDWHTRYANWYHRGKTETGHENKQYLVAHGWHELFGIVGALSLLVIMFGGIYCYFKFWI